MAGRSFSKMKFKSDAISKLGLPDIEYPVPTEKFPMLMLSGGEVKTELLIYWVMDYLSLNTEDRELYEIQLLKCAEKFAVSSGQSESTLHSCSSGMIILPPPHARDFPRMPRGQSLCLIPT